MSKYTLEDISKAKILVQTLGSAGIKREVFEILNCGVIEMEAEVCKEYPLDAVEAQHVEQGDKIPAIKHYRDRLNVSLYAAKLAVDYYKKGQRQ
jgi:ribosomal protein L7/L12